MKIDASLAGCFVLAALFLSVAPVVHGITITEADISTANSQPNGVVSGADAAIWFKEEGASKIGRLNPATGSVTGEFPTLTANAGPTGITSLGNFLWFTEQNANRIGRISTITTVIEEFSTGMSGALPNAIVAGADGALYFTERGNGKLGRVDAATGNVTEILNVTLSGPAGIVRGPDDNLWVTESGSDRIGRFNPS